MKRLLALLLPSLCACKHGGPPADLGELAADRVALEASAALRHVHQALEPGAVPTVADLYGVESIPFRSAPDPTALLRATAAANPDPAAGSIPLTVLSYNVGLLQANVFWVIPYSKSPHLDERRPVLPGLVFQDHADVICLQEVWRRSDLRRFERAAEEHGYLAFHGPRGRYNDGLVTLVRQELVAGEDTVETDAVAYEQRDSMEYFPGPGMRRGYVRVSFEHRDIGTVHVFNTHMLAWPHNWAIRMAEARQVGLDLARVTGESEIGLLAGDMNGGSYYRADTWTPPEGEPQSGWWANTLSYALLQHYGGASDLYIQGRSAEDAILDVVLGDRVQNCPEEAKQVPHCDPTFCERFRDRNFTATDCNVMYFDQYAGTEYPARMDLILGRDPARRIHVANADLAFTERVVFEDLEPMEPSDHLGVRVELRVAPAGAAAP